MKSKKWFRKSKRSGLPIYYHRLINDIVVVLILILIVETRVYVSIEMAANTISERKRKTDWRKKKTLVSNIIILYVDF